MSYDDSYDDAHHETGEPCCGACGYAAEVERAGGPASNARPYLAFERDAAGAPRGAALVLRETRGAAQREVAFDRASLVLGRTAPADIVVPIDTLSRKQCRFWCDADGVWVEDLRSSCGTFVNGGKVSERTRLREGDVVWVADLTIEVTRAGA